MASVPYAPTGRDPRRTDEIHEEDASLVNALLDLRQQIQALQRESSRILARLARNLDTVRGRERSTTREGK